MNQHSRPINLAYRMHSIQLVGIAHHSRLAMPGDHEIGSHRFNCGVRFDGTSRVRNLCVPL